MFKIASRTRLLAIGLLLLTARLLVADTTHPHILFITADDLNHDSVGCYGSPIKDLTPNLDRLASEGMRVERAYSTVAVCQPVRQTMLTGLYPHHSGSMGFFPIKSGIRTFNQQARDAGYRIAMFGKNPHYQPRDQFCVDVEETKISRDPQALADATREFIRSTLAEKRPFLHFLNCTDPHRPFIGAGGPNDLAGGSKPSRTVSVDEIAGVPGFLEDLPEVRRELSQYYTSVRRLDDCVGAVLRVLDELQVRDETLVFFYGGDHGMSFPFAKTNDYEDSSRGALIVRWPGKVAAGSVDRDHLVSTVDFTPTLLEAANLPPLPSIDGRSFFPALRGEKMTGWDRVFTCYNQSSGRNWLLMRSVRTKDQSYIWNAWSDGKIKYAAENMNGITWRAMLAAAATNPAIQARCDFYLYRVPEEYYDLNQDRYERNNRIANREDQATIDSLRSSLLDMMRRTDDPLAEAFAHRDQPELLAAAKQRLIDEYDANHAKKKKGLAAPPAASGTPPRPAAANARGKKAELIQFELPQDIQAGSVCTVVIAHRLDPSDAPQALTVTLKHQGARIERKIVMAKGTGKVEVPFEIPAALKGQMLQFAAFVGEDFKTTPQAITAGFQCR